MDWLPLVRDRVEEKDRVLGSGSGMSLIVIPGLFF